jgi:hypothetical protein
VQLVEQEEAVGDLALHLAGHPDGVPRRELAAEGALERKVRKPGERGEASSFVHAASREGGGRAQERGLAHSRLAQERDRLPPLELVPQLGELPLSPDQHRADCLRAGGVAQLDDERGPASLLRSATCRGSRTRRRHGCEPGRRSVRDPGDPDSSECQVAYTPTAGAGAHTISGSYGGSADHDPSSGETALSAARRATQTTVVCGGPAEVGGSITCTAQVDDVDAAGTRSNPTGQVDLSTDGAGIFAGDSCLLAPVAGDPDSSTCSVTYRSSAVSVDEVAAQYLGSDVHAAGAGSTTSMAVFYDPSAGFVTGGGWIWSPACAYDGSLEGRASFGFVSKYKRGAKIPTGQTEFQFTAASLNFHSAAYEWLVVSGARAQYKGTGTLNGAAGYGFLLTAVDGQAPGGGGTDKFRIKIWDAAGTVVYDNRCGADESFSTADSQELGGGSIVIHSK